jgi:glycosyltransferase involved in cell wall biosynthesis
MKRVLHVMDSLERSGMETMLLSSYDEWRRLGYACDVLATARTAGPVAEPMMEKGYGVFHIPLRSGHRFLPRLDFVRELYSLCRSGYDVVHIHSESAPMVVAPLAKLAGVPRIAVTPHNAFKFDGLLKARKRCERSFVRGLGGRYGMVSEGVLACEWDRFRNRGVRTWNWIDTSHFRPATHEERAAARRSLDLPEDAFVTSSVGNCNEAKNHTAILHALARLRPETRLIHLHVGREEPGFPERVTAVELGLGNTVRFAGSQLDPLPYLWASDAFLMPSLVEGLGLSAIEAVAAGVPLLCSNVEGLCDVAAETRWTIVTGTDEKTIAEGVRALMAMPACERTGRAREDSDRVRQRFSPRSGVRSIVRELYERDTHPEPVRQESWIPL